jgi:hypothetical protein
MWRMTPGFVRAWRLGLGLAIGAILGAAPGVVLSAASRMPMQMTMPVIVVGAGIGLPICYFLGIVLLNRAYGIDYRRMS